MPVLTFLVISRFTHNAAVVYDSFLPVSCTPAPGMELAEIPRYQSEY